MVFSKVLVIYGGELAQDVAERIASQKPDDLTSEVSLLSASERPKNLLNEGSDTLICFVLQTIENEAPTEEGGACVRFFKRKTHPEGTLLAGKFAYTVFGLGDSNLLLDRQTTTAKDCNQVAQYMDTRLEALGGNRFYPLGLDDERTELQEVEAWVTGLWAAVASS